MITNSSFQDKKDKVLGVKKQKRSWTILPLGLAVIVLIGVAYWLILEKTGENSNALSLLKKNEKLEYEGQTLRMTDVTAKVEGGKIWIPIRALKEKKIIRFEYEKNGLRIPLYAYLTMAGRVVTGISMCEPCKSTRFRIQNKKLVCNACDTEWQLETHKGIQGGCMNYPPEIIPHSMEGDRIAIEEQLVLDWKPRV